MRLAGAGEAGATGTTQESTITPRRSDVKILSVTDCLFCQIVTEEISANVVLESDRTIAFRDINPQAPTHVLVVTKEHYPSLATVADAGDGLLDEIASQAHHVAKTEGIAESGYRVVFNTGADGGQTVHHVHAHVLGGRAMTWPPG